MEHVSTSNAALTHAFVPTKVTFVGLGQMGRPMATNLAASGLPVTVWNRTLSRADGMSGVEIAGSLEESLRDADVVITMLSDDAAVRSTTLDSGGVLDHLEQGALHIGMSTVSIALCAELAEAHRKAGQHLVAAPVFGRPAAATAASLWILAERVRAQQIFEVLGQGTFAFDRPEEAALAKLAGNFLIASTIEALGETIVLGEAGGLSPQHLFDILRTTLFGSVVVDTYGAAIAARQYQPALFSLQLGLKDVDLARAAAAHYGVPVPLADLVADHLQSAIDDGPDEDQDWVALVSVLRQKAGLAP